MLCGLMISEAGRVIGGILRRSLHSIRSHGGRLL